MDTRAWKEKEKRIMPILVAAFLDKEVNDQWNWNEIVIQKAGQ